mmetsp:Transcript_51285/g.58762  ORF Transcript_51285/g.58762 Transcript_51285/m.58762 type:complete len:108 (-) Transcript_51285:45-368(-)
MLILRLPEAMEDWKTNNMVVELFPSSACKFLNSFSESLKEELFSLLFCFISTIIFQPHQSFDEISFHSAELMERYLLINFVFLLPYHRAPIMLLSLVHKYARQNVDC